MTDHSPQEVPPILPYHHGVQDDQEVPLRKFYRQMAIVALSLSAAALAISTAGLVATMTQRNSSYVFFGVCGAVVLWAASMTIAARVVFRAEGTPRHLAGIAIIANLLILAVAVAAGGIL